ncbi:metal-binding protein ZinT [Collinsella sp. AGMB00827]|uniref:Metal-binding protein ZinT n=1 Tax=Collinsella ureilytica TaxID=2869515 RepID=A0ABS7MIU5_9ACTN|nr:ZinT/AdcA family metal-binding protein [Collinsella urealyticum]MBY4797294.1 metal-binding protein ZinT [Collinsella urealyticum]
MKKTATLLTTGALALAMAPLLAGCNSAPKPAVGSEPAGSATTQTTPAKHEVSLADWEGAWNGFNGYLDNPEVAPAFDEVAKRDGKSAEEVKKDFSAKVMCDFKGIVFKGDTIELLDGFESEGGKPTGKATYTFKESRTVEHAGYTLEWDVFTSDDADAPYPVLLLMPVHGEEELVHFHMRYGNDVDELMAKDGWYPTFVKPNSTIEQIKGEITE